MHGHHLVMSSYFPGPCSLPEHQSQCDAKCPKIASPECRSPALATVFGYRTQATRSSVSACRRVGSITRQVAAESACRRTGLGDLFVSRLSQRAVLGLCALQSMCLHVEAGSLKPSQCSAPFHNTHHRQEHSTDVQSLFQLLQMANLVRPCRDSINSSVTMQVHRYCHCRSQQST